MKEGDKEKTHWKQFYYYTYCNLSPYQESGIQITVKVFIPTSQTNKITGKYLDNKCYYNQSKFQYCSNS